MSLVPGSVSASAPPRPATASEPIELEPFVPELDDVPAPTAAAASEPGAEVGDAASGGLPDGAANGELPRTDAPGVPVPSVTGELVRVAVGLAPDAPGTKDEQALLDRLERNVRASTEPVTQVRRLRIGSRRASEICREGREDLVITVGYLPDRPAPVLLSRDCRLDLELGIRAGEAAQAPGLVGALWQEHRQLVAAGAKERRVGRISPRTRNILIAGGASVLIGLAVGFLVAGVLRDEEVVLTVSP